MLSSTEKQNIAAILKNTNDPGCSRIADVIHQLLDSQRIVDIPDAVEIYLSSAEVNVSLTRAYIYANYIVGPIINRYILPALGAELSPPVRTFQEWSVNPGNRLGERLRDGMKSGAHLKAAADAIVAEVQCATLQK
jgi:hypothetical protein